MLYRLALFALLFLTAPALAQTPPDAAAAPGPAVVEVRLETSEGPIVLALEAERAPVTTANFLRYVDQHRLEGMTFYRAMQGGPGAGLIQGGVGSIPGRALPPIAHEPTTQTGLSHTDGVISMARYAPGSAAGDFFIIVGNMNFLDAAPAAPGDNLGFAAFGHVVQGMDLVRRILAAPVSPTVGEGVMRGQMLASPIQILGAARVEAAAPVAP